MREFETGARRSNNEGKVDYSGHLSPLVLEAYGKYMHKHRLQEDGQMRAADNWKAGIPMSSYKESLIRHTIDFWKAYDEGNYGECDELACAIMFNVQGFIYERCRQSKRENQAVPECDTSLDIVAAAWGVDSEPRNLLGLGGRF